MDVESITNIKISDLVPWSDKDGNPQPFGPLSPDAFRSLVEDIKSNGVMAPIIVRPHNGRFQILSGHNRVAACKKLCLNTIPAIVRDVDDDAAVLILVNTNLNQRENIKPSEKAKAYALQISSANRKGFRADLHSQPTAAEIGEKNNQSRATVFRYLRLNSLIQSLLDMVDDGKISIVSGASLSFIPKQGQHIVANVISDSGMKISPNTAERLRKMFENAQLVEKKPAYDDIEALLKGNISSVWVASNEYIKQTRQLIPNTATQEDIDAIKAAISSYFEAKQKNKSMLGGETA